MNTITDSRRPAAGGQSLGKRVQQAHFIPGRGAHAFSLEPDRNASLVDLEGLQSAVLFVEQGDAMLSGSTDLVPESNLSPSEFAAQYCDTEGRAVVEAALASGFAPSSVYRLFADGGAPGRRADIKCSSSVRCLLVAPGLAMSPEAQSAPTMLQLLLSGKADEPPLPLAQPLLDMRIAAATASAYRVAAGDYIQIVDISGKQCSDFIAFDAAALAKAEEWGIDATATRTLLGQAMATPGLHSKYFDGRMKPLVESGARHRRSA
jgi:aminomethyltransferase